MILDEFRGKCQQIYFIFSFAQFGKEFVWQKYSKIIDDSIHKNRNALAYIGSNFPNNPQLPGYSAVANMLATEFAEMLKPGREFEDLQAKMLIAFTYRLWESNFRPQIAKSLSVSEDRVKSDLMGDIRLIRNCIIHRKSAFTQELPKRLKIFSQVWNIESAPGQLHFSRDMIHSLLEQINAMRVTILDDKRDKFPLSDKPLKRHIDYLTGGLTAIGKTCLPDEDESVDSIVRSASDVITAIEDLRSKLKQFKSANKMRPQETWAN